MSRVAGEDEDEVRFRQQDPHREPAERADGAQDSSGVDLRRRVMRCRSCVSPRRRRERASRLTEVVSRPADGDGEAKHADGDRPSLQRVDGDREAGAVRPEEASEAQSRVQAEADRRKSRVPADERDGGSVGAWETVAYAQIVSDARQSRSFTDVVNGRRSADFSCRSSTDGADG